MTFKFSHIVITGAVSHLYKYGPLAYDPGKELIQSRLYPHFLPRWISFYQILLTFLLFV